VLGISIVALSPEIQQTRPLLTEEKLTVIVLTMIISSTLILALLMYRVKPGIDVRKQTEAMILVAVITAIIILGVTAKIGSDGLISVLAAILGWTAARAATNGSKAKIEPEPEPEPEEPEPEEPEPEEPEPED
jgi:hypothetical protein